MKTKLHLSGVAIAFDPHVNKVKKYPGLAQFEPAPGREQGSLYSQQKRAIADACAHLMQTTREKPGRCALILTLTSPGFTSKADEPRFISKFFDNARKTHDCGQYVWVREYTKAGYPHFHLVADWWTRDHWFTCDLRNCSHNSRRCARPIVAISRHWSALFGSHSLHSVWLGGYWYGRRIYHLRSERQCRYLTKYMGKDFGADYANPCPINGGVFPAALKLHDRPGLLQLARN